jgi:hypothetical protein
MPPLFSRPHIPLLILAALAAFGGCVAPDPYYVDTKPFDAAAAAPIPALNSREIWISPIQIRRGWGGDGTDWLDLLVAGREASAAANRWAETPRDSTAINALVSLRRMTPDPGPIRLSTHASLHSVSNGRATQRGWRPIDPNQPTERFVLSVPLKPQDRLTRGRYELRLVVPAMNETTIWYVPNLEIILDEKPIQFDLTD